MPKQKNKTAYTKPDNLLVFKKQNDLTLSALFKRWNSLEPLWRIDDDGFLDEFS